MPNAANRIPFRIDPADRYIVRQVSRTNRNSLLASFAALTAILWITGVWGWKAWYNLFAGPFRTDPTAIAKITDADAVREYFIEFHPETIQTTSLTEQRDRWRRFVAPIIQLIAPRSAHVTLRTDMVPINGKLLVVKIPEGDPTSIVRGTLRSLSSRDRDELADLLGVTDPDFENRLLPVAVDGEPIRGTYYFLLVFSLVLTLTAVRAFRKSLSRKKDPATDPVIQSIRMYRDFFEAAEEVDRELLSPTERVGNIVFTSTWMLMPRMFDFLAVPTESIVWFYGEKFDMRYTVFIPIVSWNLTVYTLPGLRYQIQCKRAELERLRKILRERIPWAFEGESRELHRLAKNNWPMFVEQVRQRRASQQRQ